MNHNGQNSIAGFRAERAELETRCESLRAKLSQVELALNGLEMAEKLLRSPTRQRERNGTLSKELREAVSSSNLEKFFTKHDVERILSERYPDRTIRSKSVSVGLSRLADEGVIALAQPKQGRTPAKYCTKENYTELSELLK